MFDKTIWKETKNFRGFQLCIDGLGIYFLFYEGDIAAAGVSIQWWKECRGIWSWNYSPEEIDRLKADEAWWEENSTMYEDWDWEWQQYEDVRDWNQYHIEEVNLAG